MDFVYVNKIKQKQKKVICIIAISKQFHRKYKNNTINIQVKK